MELAPNSARCFPSGWPGAAARQRYPGAALPDGVQEARRAPGAQRRGAPAPHGGGPEGVVQTRPPQHARLCQEEEAHPAGELLSS